VHHLAAEEAAAHVASRAHAHASRQRFLVRRVEVHEAQHHRTAVVVDPRHQLPPRPVRDLRVDHHAFHLHRVAVVRVGDARQPRLVFIAQRHVQREVDVALQTHALERARGPGRLGCHPRLRYRACLNRGLGHGTILQR
jgi:hypothetical protein